ncbi:ATP-binding protein [Caldimonas tepidiphila]|uniref:ATP-binding protein n=1 Tax=Caldimonas tepidiphila TaxID=2315841 RepID=UPI0013006DD9|nr:sensor histidine kinase [Caldimonas tepidiphila]
MKLSEFIERNVDSIVEEWTEHAQANLPSARGLPPEELRDHTKQLLLHIADDMDTPQSGEDRHEKSRGNRPENAPEITRTAKADADQRFGLGFSLGEMAAEYRALRASVVRRWTERLSVVNLGMLDELTRFNEALDQAASDSIAWYVDRVEESRKLLLGVLGHDLRNPLGAARNSADYLLRTEGLTHAQTKAVVRIRSSTDRIRQLVSDLLDLTLTRLGGSLPITLGPANLGQVCRQTLDELEAFHPDRQLQMDCAGELTGEWDVLRIGQLLSNLIANAIQHGDPSTPVTVSVQEQGDSVAVQVHNQGPVIAPEARRKLFDPMTRPVTQHAEGREGSSGLGLGLYIVREIAVAHGGEIKVDSSEREGTTFTVRLPRKPSAKGASTGVAST